MWPLPPSLLWLGNCGGGNCHKLLKFRKLGKKRPARRLWWEGRSTLWLVFDDEAVGVVGVVSHGRGVEHEGTFAEFAVRTLAADETVAALACGTFHLAWGWRGGEQEFHIVHVVAGDDEHGIHFLLLGGVVDEVAPAGEFPEAFLLHHLLGCLDVHTDGVVGDVEGGVHHLALCLEAEQHGAK